MSLRHKRALPLMFILVWFTGLCLFAGFNDDWIWYIAAAFCGLGMLICSACLTWRWVLIRVTRIVLKTKGGVLSAVAEAFEGCLATIIKRNMKNGK